MRCRRALGALFALLLLLPLLLSVRALAASDADEAIERTEKELFSSFLDALPDAARDAFPTSPEDVNALSEAVGVERLLSMLISAAEGTLAESGSSHLRLLGVALIVSCVSLLGGFLGKSRFAELFVRALPSLAVFRLMSATVERALLAIGELSSFSLAISPIYAAVFATGGGTMEATAASGGFAVFVGILEGIVKGALTPLLRILLAMALATSLSPLPSAVQIEKRIRSAFLWILSLISMLFCASLAFEKSLASSADSVALRTVRFTLGSGIPVVGGTVSSMLGALHASLSLMRSSFGIGALIVLLSLLLPPVCELLLLRLTLSVGEWIAESLGATGVGAVYGRYRGALDLLLAVLVITGAMFLVLVGILSRGYAA